MYYKHFTDLNLKGQKSVGLQKLLVKITKLLFP